MLLHWRRAHRYIGFDESMARVSYRQRTEILMGRWTDERDRQWERGVPAIFSITVSLVSSSWCIFSWLQGLNTAFVFFWVMLWWALTCCLLTAHFNICLQFFVFCHAFEVTMTGNKEYFEFNHAYRLLVLSFVGQNITHTRVCYKCLYFLRGIPHVLFLLMINEVQ